MGDQESVGGDAEGCMVMEASPASSFVMAEPEFLFELLVVALDAPPEFRRVD